jgi:hypothetical protein
MLLFFSLYLLSHSQSYSQSLGFGCLGLVGGYGGYTYQEFQPELLNDYVEQFNEFQVEPLENFGKSEGYRFGVNFFRARFSGFFVTAKGFYQQMKESHGAQRNNRGVIEDFNYELKFQSLGLGLDLGIPIFDRFLWKIVDGALLVNSTRFTETLNSRAGTKVKKFNNKNWKLTYSIGSGFVLDIIKNYISIEGIVGYNIFNVDEMISDDKTNFEDILISNSSNKHFIKSGGISATVQLNIGFPL